MCIHSGIGQLFGVLLAAIATSVSSGQAPCGTVPTAADMERMRRMVDSGEWAQATHWLDQRGVGGIEAMVAMTIHIIRYDNGSGGLPQDRVDLAISDLNGLIADTGLIFFQEGPTLYHDDSDLAESTYDDFCSIVNTSPVPNTVNCYFIPIYQGLCGVASYPGPNCQGVTMANDCTATSWNHSTFTHETGHYFYLPHTHSTSFGAECVDGSNCDTAGDLFCDTPADPNLSGVVDQSTCAYTGTSLDACGSGLPYNPDTQNIMSYSTKLCRDQLSSQQLSVFASTAMTNMYRIDELRDPGGCCVGTSCFIAAESNCEGTWLGAFSDCTGDPCNSGNPQGACCVGTFCTETTQGDCSGDWLGAGTTCIGDPCSSSNPTGACCINETCTITTEAGCAGEWQGPETNCNGSPCGTTDPLGACCINETCTITTEVGCAGDWLGADTNCNGSPCDTPDPFGACCEGTFCWVGTEPACTGTWQGEGTNCLGSPCPPDPQFLLVPTDYATIQSAIDVSTDGDTVLVAPGTYTGTGSQVIKLKGRAIEVRSIGGAAVTTIDGESLRQGVVCSSNESSSTIINGFTITGGAANWGGGIYCGGSSPTFRDCVITGNTASTRGGGAYVFQGSPTFDACTWTSNTSDAGAAIYASNASPALIGCSFKHNSATTTGGAIHASSGGLMLSGSELCHNLPNHVSGDWMDGGSNTMSDGCQGCAADIGTMDSVVDQTDVQAMIAAWGTSGDLADLDGDGSVGIGDLLILLTSWGPC